MNRQRQPDKVPGEAEGQGGLKIPADYAGTTARALSGVLRLQSTVALLLALLLLLVGQVEAYSSLFGSLSVYIPGMLFTLFVGRKLGASSTAFLRTAALAEFGKLVLTGLLCGLVFVWVKPLAPAWFFIGMLAVLATSWIGLAKAIR